MQPSMPLVFKHRLAGPLGRYVESFWYVPAVGGGMLILPVGRPKLVICLDGAPQRNWTSLHEGGQSRRLHHATVYLPGCEPVASVLEGRRGTFGVSFWPHGLRPFIRLALTDLGSPTVALPDLWGPRAQEELARLTEAPTLAGKFAVMEKLLLQHLREPHGAHGQIERAVALLSDPFANRSVEAVAREVALSPRRLLHLFREDVGLTPKMFSRVMRFSAALRLVREKGPMRWTEVAAMCNYADQAHFAREFRELAGMSPTAYLERRVAGHANCLPWTPPGLAAPRRELAQLEG